MTETKNRRLDETFSKVTWAPSIDVTEDKSVTAGQIWSYGQPKTDTTHKGMEQQALIILHLSVV